MLLATTTVEDFDRRMKVFSTTSADKRKQDGSKGSLIFGDPNEANRVWVSFDWDVEGVAALRVGYGGSRESEARWAYKPGAVVGACGGV